MIRPSFVPPPEIRRLRDLTRYRADLVAARTAEKQRVEKLLEDAQIKLSAVASDIFGVSGRQMLAALIAGQRDPRALAQLARGVMRAKITTLQEAFTGYFTDRHAFLLAKMLARVDVMDADIAALDKQIEQVVTPFAAAVQRLAEIRASAAPPRARSWPRSAPTWAGSPPPGTCSPGPSSPPASRSPPGRRRAKARPGTAAATWPGSSATPPPRPGAVPHRRVRVRGDAAVAFLADSDRQRDELLGPDVQRAPAACAES
jgi:cell division protein FtsB